MCLQCLHITRQQTTCNYGNTTSSFHAQNWNMSEMFKIQEKNQNRSLANGISNFTFKLKNKKEFFQTCTCRICLGIFSWGKWSTYLLINTEGNIRWDTGPGYKFYTYNIHLHHRVRAQNLLCQKIRWNEETAGGVKNWTPPQKKKKQEKIWRDSIFW